VILFHGTGGGRELLPALWRDGLLPAARPWAHEATGVGDHVFACSTAIGSRGGDPIAFAQRRVWRDDQDAWLVVLDVPAERVRGAVPNVELQLWWKTRELVRVVFDAKHRGHAQRVLDAMRARGVAARELLAYRVASVADGLCDGAPDADTLVQFERAYLRAVAGDKARVAASYGLRVPAWFADDGHYPSCAGCMHQLVVVEVVAPTVDGGYGTTIAFPRGAWDRVDLATFGAAFDALARWLDHAGAPRLPARVTDLPPAREVVPRTFWPDFATHDVAARAREPDTQVLLPHVPPAQLVGAIHLGGRARLSDLVRPARGETLAGKLAYATRRLVELRGSSERPITLTRM
jgi:hypothetical protein